MLVGGGDDGSGKSCVDSFSTANIKGINSPTFGIHTTTIWFQHTIINI